MDKNTTPVEVIDRAKEMVGRKIITHSNNFTIFTEVEIPSILAFVRFYWTGHDWSPSAEDSPHVTDRELAGEAFHEVIKKFPDLHICLINIESVTAEESMVLQSFEHAA